MGVAFQVMHDQRGAVDVGQRIDRSGQALSKIGIDAVALGMDRVQGIEVVEVGLALTKAPDLPHGVGDDGDGDAMKPGAEGGVAAEVGEPVKGTNKGVLREFPRELRVTR